MVNRRPLIYISKNNPGNRQDFDTYKEEPAARLNGLSFIPRMLVLEEETCHGICIHIHTHTHHTQKYTHIQYTINKKIEKEMRVIVMRIVNSSGAEGTIFALEETLNHSRDHLITAMMRVERTVITCSYHTERKNSVKYTIA